MYEVEIKVRADHGPVRDRLRDLGARRVGRVQQVDTYYDAPDRSFADTDEALRIRREVAGDDGEATEERIRLTYKGPKVDDDTQTREEFEVGVGDAEAVAGILDGLGYRAVATVEKERTTYELDGYEVTLDSVAGLGTFLEVEREVEAAGVDGAREGARDLLERLGVDPERGIRESYLELVLMGDGGE